MRWLFTNEENNFIFIYKDNNKTNYFLDRPLLY